MRKLMAILISLLILPISAVDANWKFYDDMSDWKKSGWYVTPDALVDWQGIPNRNGEIIQNRDGTVTIKDTTNLGRFYIGHKFSFEIPFTLQVRLRFKEGSVPFIQANFDDGRSVYFNFLSLPNIAETLRTFHVYTLIINKHEEVYLYNETFKYPSIIKLKDFKARQHGMGADLIIGFPMAGKGEIILDYVAYGTGEIRSLAGGTTYNVTSGGKLFTRWGKLMLYK